MQRLIKVTLPALLTIASGVLMAQDSASSVEMADTMRSSGKIYVVVAVVVVVFAGLLVYLWRIERKVSKLEDFVRQREKLHDRDDRTKHN